MFVFLCNTKKGTYLWGRLWWLPSWLELWPFVWDRLSGQIGWQQPLPGILVLDALVNDGSVEPVLRRRQLRSLRSGHWPYFVYVVSIFFPLAFPQKNPRKATFELELESLRNSDWVHNEFTLPPEYQSLPKSGTLLWSFWEGNWALHWLPPCAN